MEVPIKIYTKDSASIIKELFGNDKTKEIRLDGVKIKYHGVGVEESYFTDALPTIVKITMDFFDRNKEAIAINLVSSLLFRILSKLGSRLTSKKLEFSEEDIRKIFSEELKKSKKH